MLTSPVKIFTASESTRLNFVADLILGQILGLSWSIITDRRRLGKSPVINYSDHSIPGSFRVRPVSLLFEKGVRHQDITLGEWKNLPVFFLTNQDSDIPFDIFAAAFYMVSRYEEYSEYSADGDGRFTASSSLAFRNGFLGIPVVDLWVRELAKVLVKRYQFLSFKRNEFRSLINIVVDEPFAYKGRSLIGNIGGLFHDITSRTGKASHRLGCLAGKEKDPFEVYDYLSGKIERQKADSRFFVAVGDSSRYEDNPSWKNEDYRKLIRNVAEKYKVGLHSSFRASTDFRAASTEIKRLGTITGKDISENRFHFLKIVIPDSYRNISLAGIKEDYSMGYHDEPGFRAGTARAYLFYDITEDRITNLRITPFQIMDVALRFKKAGTVSTKEIIKKMMDETRNAGGLFVSIWHNTTLLDTPECLEWRDAFEFTLAGQ